ncbi:hypothetical protein SKAU_G00096190 [Synaphobranchus kaupii]|uniref:DDE Tnp4 domain-containing protein n=1 Tax=Synaphobranchus kaupii TaxID=118154 RepID=A0A9Q1FYL5_SYNKA|nr:hypothetical protein SKAU_G00096190 [Synaphobranchus kaupii]
MSGDTKRDFRLARVTLNLLIETLEEDNTLGWGKILEVLVFLNWLASATSYRVVSEAFGIPSQDLEMVGAGFAHLARSPAFRRTAGSNDSCHIRVVPPAAESQDYLNRKLFYSVQMQAICYHRGTFLNVFTGYPGSVHDAQILRLSDVYVHWQYPPDRGWWISLYPGPHHPHHHLSGASPRSCAGMLQFTAVKGQGCSGAGLRATNSSQSAFQ